MNIFVYGIYSDIYSVYIYSQLSQTFTMLSNIDHGYPVNFYISLEKREKSTMCLQWYDRSPANLSLKVHSC